MQRFSILNLNHNGYVRLLKRIKYDYLLYVILRYSAEVELFCDLIRLFDKHGGIVLSFGKTSNGVEIIRVQQSFCVQACLHTKNDVLPCAKGAPSKLNYNIVYHEVTGTGIMRKITTKCHKFVKDLEDFQTITNAKNWLLVC